VAVDGGADAALAAGLRPEAVVGDLDSLSPQGRAALAPVLHEIAEQETTDFDKALRSVAAPVCVAVGFMGGRFDHTLAVCSVLAHHADRPCVVVGSESVMCLCPPELDLDLAPGTTVSLWPLAEVRCASEGLRWPTEGLVFDPLGRIGTSNAAEGPVRLAPSAPRLLLVLPKAEHDRLVRALAGPAPPGRWPAPAAR